MDAAERFARDVVAGKVPLAESARLACERHLADLRRRDWRWRWDGATADRIMDFCRDLTLSGGQWEGRPWEPLPWQAFLLRSVFGWVDSVGVRRFRKVYVETPKGSGKVMLSAAAALYLLHLDGEKRPEVYLLAETGDQAQIIFDCARQVMDRSEDLSSLGYIYGGDVVPNRIMAHDGGFIRRVDRAQGGKGRSGFVPSGIFVDELHEVRDTGLIQLYEAGTKSRVRPLTFITTNTGAGAAQGTPCWIEHAYALRVVRGGVEDDRYLSFVVELDRDLDKTIFQREDLWPAFNVSLPATPGYEYLRDQVKAAAASPSRRSEVLRLAFGRWADAADPWLDVDAWKGCLTAPEDVPPADGPMVVGLDLSERTDLSGGAVAWEIGDGRVGLAVTGWTPEYGIAERAQTDAADYEQWVEDGHLVATPGRIVDYSVVAEWLMEHARSEHGVRCVGMDTFGRTHFREALGKLDVEMAGSLAESGGGEMALVYHPQGFTANMKAQEEKRGDGNVYPSMPTSLSDFEQLVVKGELVVCESPALTAGILSAVTIRDGAGNRKLSKTKAYGRIDLCVAAVCAVGILTQLRMADDMGEMDQWLAA